MSFSGKTVLITGGASGMGLLSGKCFAKEGANVVLVDFDKEGLNAAVEEVKEITPNVIGCCTDVRDYNQVKKSCEDAVESFGTIDVLISCAGGAEVRIMGAKGDFSELPIEVVDFGIDVNLKGAMYYDHAVLPYMKKQRSGVIIHLGSITGYEGSKSNVAYSASKSALMNGVVKSIALLGADYGIRACTVAPGPVMTRPGMAKMKTLMGYPAEPQELVDMFMFLASDKARSITGTTIMVDGGRSVMYNK